MPLSCFRRHTSQCLGKYRPSDRSGKDCRCKISVEGKLGDEFIRASTGTRSWPKAEVMRRQAERTGTWEDRLLSNEPVSVCITVREAVNTFLSRREAKSGSNLQRVTVSKYRTAVERFAEWCEESGYPRMTDVHKVVMATFQDSWVEWQIGSLTASNYVARLRVFGTFAVKRGWWTENLAHELENPTDFEHTERSPFSDGEVDALLKATREVELDVQQRVDNFELETFALMMRCAGMAICDVALLKKDEIVGDEVQYFRKKTLRRKNRVKAVVPLPEWLLKRLNKLSEERGLLGAKQYYFCHGSDLLISAASAWHKRFRQVFDLAGIERCETHRFRHTFATKMLSRKIALPGGGHGYIPVSVVARWLGHSSEKTTLKYYSHWITERQEIASNIMRSVHSEDAAISA